MVLKSLYLHFKAHNKISIFRPRIRGKITSKTWQHTYLRTIWKYYSWIGLKNHSKLFTGWKNKMGASISFVEKGCSRSIQTEYLLSTHNFSYKISMFLPKVESLILHTYSSKKTRHYSKKRKLLVTEVNVLSIFLNLGKNIMFCNNEKDFYKTRTMFWTEHILSLLNLLCHIFFHFYIFQESTFCILHFHAE